MKYQKAVDSELEGMSLQGFLTVTREKIIALFGDPLIRADRTWPNGIYFEWPVKFNFGDNYIVGAIFGDDTDDKWRVAGRDTRPLILFSQLLTGSTSKFGTAPTASTLGGGISESHFGAIVREDDE